MGTLQEHARSTSHPENRPFPLRAYSKFETREVNLHEGSDPNHTRTKSTHTFSSSTPSRSRRPRTIESDQSRLAIEVDIQDNLDGNSLFVLEEQGEGGTTQSPHHTATTSTLTLLASLPKAHGNAAANTDPLRLDVSIYDFSKIDYELDRAQEIGKGLWSLVYFAQPVTRSRKPDNADALTPPSTPQQRKFTPSCSFYAVKIVARPDAKYVFRQEARILTVLQRTQDSHEYVVPFLGLDPRTSDLVFEGVIGGSLEKMVGRLNVMTEVARHLELRSLFFNLAYDLVSGLRFIHATGVIHSDIKPANVLLDVSENQSHTSTVIRARYIDFSSSFLSDNDSPEHAGGTWDYMAPEQLCTQKNMKTPTFASDIWSLGLTLLFVIAGGSPYAAACGENLFRLREAVKNGDPLAFARMDPVVQMRLYASQDFIDCCRHALQKDRNRRSTAAAWQRWLEYRYITN